MFDDSQDDLPRRTGWGLVDPRPLQVENPFTFFLPSYAEKSAIEPGEVVKLIFEGADPEAPHERMWVVYEGRDEDGWFGKLDNEPCCIAGLALGDRVRFRSHHIVAVWDTKVDDAETEERMFDRCHVDPRVLDGARIGAMERRAPSRLRWLRRRGDRPETGWHIYAGGHPRPTVREMSHVAIGCVLNRDASIARYLSAPHGTRMTREGDTFRQA